MKDKVEKLTQDLKRHEGCVLIPYQDIYGNWTLGYGHLMSNPITKEAAEKILYDDIAIAINSFRLLPVAFRRNLNEARRRVVVNMIFNMGRKNFLTFKKMIKAVKEEKFAEAAVEMADSKWCRDDVGPKRAGELAEIMRHGKEV